MEVATQIIFDDTYFKDNNFSGFQHLFFLMEVATWLISQVEN
jgi:hypothetical protein